MKLHQLTVLAVVAATQLGATDCGQVLKDPGFDLWCGDTLCAWKLERGTIERAPTWHEKDAGVAFTGDDDAIEQFAPVNDGDGHCIVFDLIADVDLGADVMLNIDIEGDGSVERSEPIPTSHWQPLQYAIAIAPPFDGVRFEITKHGSAHAVVAQIAAHTDASACDGLVPIASADPAPDGGRCGLGTDCTSGSCTGGIFGGVCQGCDSLGGSCAGGICGLGDPRGPAFPIPQTCVAVHAKELGEHCALGVECASTVCVEATCSSCDPAGAACAGGLTCDAAYTIPNGGQANRAYVCGAGSHLVATGGACGADTDCASAHCNGAVREQCLDGRACSTAASCPAIGLDPTPCSTVGIQGGSCQ